MDLFRNFQVYSSQKKLKKIKKLPNICVMDISKKHLKLLRIFLKHFLVNFQKLPLFSTTLVWFFETLKCKHLNPNNFFNLLSQTQLVFQNKNTLPFKMKYLTLYDYLCINQFLILMKFLSEIFYGHLGVFLSLYIYWVKVCIFLQHVDMFDYKFGHM